ncbi:MAG: hypothetical protein AB7I38_20000 [Dehalococcoidia bacterium]
MSGKPPPIDLTTGPFPSLAMLRWGEHEPDWRGYATGYRRASDALLGLAVERQVSIDLVVFPLGALLRQSVELHLKWLTVSIREQLGASTALAKNHDLDGLWERLRAPLRPLGLDEPQWEHLRSKIRILSQLDRTGETFRYPTTTKGRPSIEVDSLDVRKLADVVAEVLDVLEALVDAVTDEGRQRAEEAMADAARAWWSSLPDEEREQYEAEEAELHEAYIRGDPL